MVESSAERDLITLETFGAVMTIDLFRLLRGSKFKAGCVVSGREEKKLRADDEGWKGRKSSVGP